VAAATDRQLIEWRDELEGIIRRSPIATDPSDQIVALDAAIAEARETADRLGTSGAVRQAGSLEEQRERLIGELASRAAWLDENAHVLHRYSAVVEELQHRVNARVAAYQLSPPVEILEALGDPPAHDDVTQRRWTAAIAQYAEARMALGPDADLADPAVLHGASWREAMMQLAWSAVPEIEKSPLLHRTV
jgi:hypothetical protein